MRSPGSQWTPFHATGGRWGYETGTYGSLSAGTTWIGPTRHVAGNMPAPSTGYSLNRQALPWGTAGKIIAPLTTPLKRGLRQHLTGETHNPNEPVTTRDMERMLHQRFPGAPESAPQVPTATINATPATQGPKSRKMTNPNQGTLFDVDTPVTPEVKSRLQSFKGMRPMF